MLRMKLMMICCGMKGLLGMSVRKIKTPTVKIETVTPIGKGK